MGAFQEAGVHSWTNCIVSLFNKTVIIYLLDENLALTTVYMGDVLKS